MNDITNKSGSDSKDSKVIFMDFFADWCGPCKVQDPIIDDLKKKFDNKVEFKKIDVDKDYDLADRYMVNSIPTMIIEKDGKLWARFVGVTKTHVLEKKIKEILK